MRLLLFLSVCFLFTSCNNGSMSHRPTYVISQYGETGTDVEPATESLVE